MTRVTRCAASPVHAGSLLVVTGSHRSDLELDYRAPRPEAAEELELAAGDAVVTDNRLLHAAARNTTRRPRRALYFTYGYRWLKPLSLETVLYLMARCQSDEVRQWISNYYTHLRTVKTSLDGNDLHQLNIPEGPHYKKILDTILDARLNGRVSSRDEEISLVRKRFSKFIDG